MTEHSLAVQRASGKVSIPAKYAASMWVLIERVLTDLRMLESDVRVEHMSKKAALRATYLLSDAIHNLPRTLVECATEIAPAMVDIALESLRSASQEIWGMRSAMEGLSRICAPMCRGGLMNRTAASLRGERSTR